MPEGFGYKANVKIMLFRWIFYTEKRRGQSSKLAEGGDSACLEHVK